MAKKQVNPFDTLISDFSNEIVKMVHSIPRVEAPPGSVKLKPAEVKANYLAMRESPEEWSKILQKHGFQGAVEYWWAQEGRENGKTENK